MRGEREERKKEGRRGERSYDERKETEEWGHVIGLSYGIRTWGKGMMMMTCFLMGYGGWVWYGMMDVCE